MLLREIRGCDSVRVSFNESGGGLDRKAILGCDPEYPVFLGKLHQTFFLTYGTDARIWDLEPVELLICWNVAHG